MSKVDNIERDVERLTPSELEAFRLVYEYDTRTWDKQIEDERWVKPRADRQRNRPPGNPWTRMMFSFRSPFDGAQDERNFEAIIAGYQYFMVSYWGVVSLSLSCALSVAMAFAIRLFNSSNPSPVTAEMAQN